MLFKILYQRQNTTNSVDSVASQCLPTGMRPTARSLSFAESGWESLRVKPVVCNRCFVMSLI